MRAPRLISLGRGRTESCGTRGAASRKQLHRGFRHLLLAEHVEGEVQPEAQSRGSARSRASHLSAAASFAFKSAGPEGSARTTSASAVRGRSRPARRHEEGGRALLALIAVAVAACGDEGGDTTINQTTTVIKEAPATTGNTQTDGPTIETSSNQEFSGPCQRLTRADSDADRLRGPPGHGRAVRIRQAGGRRVRGRLRTRLLWRLQQVGRGDSLRNTTAGSRRGRLRGGANRGPVHDLWRGLDRVDAVHGFFSRRRAAGDWMRWHPQTTVIKK